MENTINSLIEQFNIFAQRGYRWNNQNIITFNNLLNNINRNIDKLNYQNLFYIFTKLQFILNDISKNRKVTNKNCIKNNLINLLSALFNKLQNNKRIEAKNISLILNALSNFRYTRQDLERNGLDIRLLIDVINNIVLIQGNSQDIANTLNALSRFGYTRQDLERNGLDIRLLINAINNIVLTQGNSQGIANTLNALSNFEYTRQDLERNSLDIRLLIDVINNIVLTQGNSQGIANTLNALSNFEYTRQDLERNSLDIRLLIDVINNIVLTQGNSQDIANILNALSNFEYTRQDLERNSLDIRLLIDVINNIVLTQGNSQGIANTLNALSRFEYTRQDLERNGLDIRLLIDVINNIVLKQGNSQEIANILNALSNFEYTRQDLERNSLDIRLLINVINNIVLTQGNSQGIANTLNALSRFEYTRQDLERNGLDIRLLIDVINNIVLKQGNSQEIANTLNALSRFGYIRQDLERNGLNIRLLIDAINNIVLKQGNSQNITNTLNALSNFGYTRQDLERNLDIRLLINVINNIVLKQGNSQGIANTLNALSNFRYTRQDLERNGLDIILLIDAINNIVLKQGNSQDIANTLNALVNIFIINCNIKDKNIRICIDRIISKLKTLKENELLNETKTSLNIDLSYLKYIFGVNIAKQLFEKLSNYKINDKEKISVLEKKFNQFLNRNLIEKDNIEIITDEFIEENIDGLIFKHRPDFVIIYNNKKYFIELDGPCHFIDSEETIKNASTIKRDFLLQKYCEKNEIIYITISDKKFNSFKNKQFKNFEEFLYNEILNIKEEKTEEKETKEMKEVQEVKEIKEMKEITTNTKPISRSPNYKENKQLINAYVPNKKMSILPNIDNRNYQNIILTNSNTNRNMVLDILGNVRPNGYGFIGVGNFDNTIYFQYNNLIYSIPNDQNIRIINFSEEQNMQNNNIDNDGSYIVNLPNHFVAVRRITINNQIYFFGIDSLNHENNNLRQILSNRYPNARFINLQTDIIQQNPSKTNKDIDDADRNACAIWAYTNAVALSQIDSNRLINSINGGIVELPNIDNITLLNNLINIGNDLDDLFKNKKGKQFD